MLRFNTLELSMAVHAFQTATGLRKSVLWHLVKRGGRESFFCFVHRYNLKTLPRKSVLGGLCEAKVVRSSWKIS